MAKRIPKTLYHYCSVDSFYNIIKSRSIWLSDIGKSNDLRELKWLKEKCETYILKYWLDYVKDCPEDKLKDIICMANNLENRDAYLIYGANDDGSIYGIENTRMPRISSAGLTEFLRSKPFAGGYYPQTDVKTINVGEHQLDIVIIYNSRHMSIEV